MEEKAPFAEKFLVFILAMGLMFYSALVELRFWQWHVTPWVDVPAPPYAFFIVIGFLWMIGWYPMWGEAAAIEKVNEKGGAFTAISAKGFLWAVAHLVVWATAP